MATQSAPGLDAPFRKVVLWGHKLHTHTHSYIHFGFYRAFSELGFSVDWLDATDDIDGYDFSDTLFITEGQVAHGMPRRKDATYVLHNCDPERHSGIYQLGNWLNIQVYTDVCREKGFEQVDEHVYFDRTTRTLHMPWATDLLPQEIDRLDSTHPVLDVEPEACFVGTVGDGRFGNRSELLPFISACSDQGIRFVHHQNVDFDDAIGAIRRALLAPAIQGKWQLQEGYIPCRIFKNISYGQIGITNSPAVRNLFGGSIVYHENTAELLPEALGYMQSDSAVEIAKVRQWVRDNHTYLNRIRILLEMLDRYASSPPISPNTR